MTRSDDLLALWEVRDRFVEGDRWFERALELPGDFCRPRAASLSMLGRHRRGCHPPDQLRGPLHSRAWCCI